MLYTYEYSVRPVSAWLLQMALCFWMFDSDGIPRDPRVEPRSGTYLRFNLMPYFGLV